MKFTGKVIKGVQLGAKFGVATANLELSQKPELKEGVYFVKVTLNNQKNLNGIMHFGELKTFGGSFTVEVHLFDFADDIYEEELKIGVLRFLRPTVKFQNADELFSQIEDDLIKAQKYFLRQKIYNHWKTLKPEVLDKFTKKTLEKISVLDELREAQNVFIYAPEEQREIDFVEDLMQKFPDKNYYFPKVINQEMSFYLVKNFKDLKPGKFNILEPVETHGHASFDLPNPDIIFVPGVSGNESGERLGKGGGFYDRFLEAHSDIFTLMILPYFAKSDKIPVELHDQKIDKNIFIT